MITPNFSNPLLGTFFALLAAWKATTLLDVDNRLIAVAFAAALAVAGPYLMADYITASFAGPDTADQAKTAKLIMMPLFASRIGFALIGVLAWSMIEGRRA
jgi:hypothetical protein